MSGDVTIGYLKRVSRTPDGNNFGNLIGGQNFYDIYFTGGTISNVNITNATITLDAIDNTPIGATTPSAGKFTSLASTNLLTTPSWANNNIGQRVTMPTVSSGSANGITAFQIDGAALTGAASASNYNSLVINGISITGNTVNVTNISSLFIGMGTLATSASVTSMNGQEISMPQLGSSCHLSFARGRHGC